MYPPCRNHASQLGTVIKKVRKQEVIVVSYAMKGYTLIRSNAKKITENVKNKESGGKDLR
jgi:hypothetical protein